MIIETNVPLAPYTSWLIGGPADFFCLPETEEQLSEALTIAKDKQFQ
jgi:UDP-N-acetylmuramate dehydrogenase